MFAVELKFESSARGGSSDAKRDAIGWLIAAFVRNGSLMEQFEAEGAGEKFSVYGMTPARNAFHRANWNDRVRIQIAALKAANLKRPQIRILGIIPETAAVCQCAKPNGYVLFTTFLSVEPPLRCIDCNDTIPVYNLPRPAVGEHQGLFSWRSDYLACDTLQMNCTVGERFGERQMSDSKSQLSRSGIAVCKEIERLTGRPTYYYLYRASGRTHAAETRRRCPTCNGEWLMKQPLHYKFDFKCDQCRLMSNIAWNVR
jgi:predicted  nucleic acid-binding Zn ribbon protein